MNFKTAVALFAFILSSAFFTVNCSRSQSSGSDYNWRNSPDYERMKTVRRSDDFDTTAYAVAAFDDRQKSKKDDSIFTSKVVMYGSVGLALTSLTAFTVYIFKTHGKK